jgi:integrase
VLLITFAKQWSASNPFASHQPFACAAVLCGSPMTVTLCVVARSPEAKWSDIDFDARTITIARNRVQVGAATVVENEPKTQSSRRTLPLDEGLISVLKRASVRYAEEKLALGAAHLDSGYVACNEAGKPYTPGALTNMWHRLTAAAGVRPIRLHDARHSCGTALHLRGVPMAVIAKWLGPPTPQSRHASTPTRRTRRCAPQAQR